MHIEELGHNRTVDPCLEVIRDEGLVFGNQMIGMAVIDEFGGHISCFAE